MQCSMMELIRIAVLVAVEGAWSIIYRTKEGFAIPCENQCDFSRRRRLSVKAREVVCSLNSLARTSTNAL